MNTDTQRAAEQTQGYAELAGRTYSLMVEAYANANQRMLGYGKALYEIVSRPYSSSAVESAARENFDRANQVVDLTVQTLATNGAENAKFAKTLAEQVGAWQEQSMEMARGMMRTGVSNLTYVKDTTDKQFEQFAARVDEMRAQTQATSRN